jgi:hypothetical protein
VGFETKIPAVERAKAVHAIDRAATVIGTFCFTSANFVSHGRHNNEITICVPIGQAVFPLYLIKRGDGQPFLLGAGIILNTRGNKYPSGIMPSHVSDVISPVAYCSINGSIARNKVPILQIFSVVCISQYIHFFKKREREKKRWAVGGEHVKQKML